MAVIMVLDDRRTNRTILTQLATSLDPDGRVKPFASPVEALEWSRTNTPDLVVTDFKMPVMDGAEFIRRFQEIPSCVDVPIIVVTRYEDQRYRYAALDAGASDFLLAPIDYQEFRARCRNLLTLRDSQKRLRERARSLETRIAQATDQHERALRESHSRLLGVIDALPVMIWATAADGRIAFINRLAADLLDVSVDEAVGRALDDVMDPAWGSKLAETDRAILATGDLPPRFEQVVPTRSGSRIFLVTKTALWNDAGAVAHVVTAAFDITDRKGMEARLIEAKNAAELANRSKSEFLANMSHELRTPLNAVVGFAQLIAGEVFGPVGNAKYVEYSKIIEESGSLLCSIIGDILDVSKIEAGEVVLLEEEILLGTLLGDVVRLAEQRAQSHGVVVQPRLDTSIERLWADEVKLKQILLNLVTNAVKFSEPGGRVVLAAEDGPDGGLILRVADTGIGMTKDEIAVAVERFGRVETNATKRMPGTGLGLPLAIALTELHHGTLTVESEKGVGTTVTVSLPASRVIERPKRQACT